MLRFVFDFFTFSKHIIKLNYRKLFSFKCVESQRQDSAEGVFVTCGDVECQFTYIIYSTFDNISINE